jgi:hypothetical protein
VKQSPWQTHSASGYSIQSHFMERVQTFPINIGEPQKSWRQKVDKKQHSYWGPINARHHRRKFSPPPPTGVAAAGICEPLFYKTRKLITIFTRVCHLFLFWARSIPSTTSRSVFKINFNIILPSMSMVYKMALSFRFSHKNPLCNSRLPHTCPPPFFCIWSPVFGEV